MADPPASIVLPPRRPIDTHLRLAHATDLLGSILSSQVPGQEVARMNQTHDSVSMVINPNPGGAF
jgi:hypothetical protein